MLMWGLCGILTATDVLPPDSPLRTDLKASILNEAAWVRVPYPCKFVDKLRRELLDLHVPLQFSGACPS